MEAGIFDRSYLYNRPRISHRVGVTGMGLVCGLGNNVEDAWDALKSGKSGIQNIDESNWDPEQKEWVARSEVRLGGLVNNFSIQYIDKKDLRRMHRFTQLGIEAGRQALIQAKLLQPLDHYEQGGSPLIEGVDPNSIGVYGATGIGGGTEIGRARLRINAKGAHFTDPFTMLRLLPCRAAAIMSMYFDLRGEIMTINAACASGTEAIAVGYKAVERGDVKAVVIVASEAAIDDVAYCAFDKIRALSRLNNEPYKAATAFDENPLGMVCAEGAGVVVLESFESAEERNVPILVELAGFGITADAYDDTSPNKKSDPIYKGGPARAMKLALHRAQVSPADVKYVNTHGTGTASGGPAELEAYEEVWGEDIYKTIINSTKTQTGHLLGAAGAVEGVFTIKTMETGTITKQQNLTNPVMQGFNFPLKGNVETQVDIAMSNSFGFGGHNASLVFRAVNLDLERNEYIEYQNAA